MVRRCWADWEILQGNFKDAKAPTCMQQGMQAKQGNVRARATTAMTPTLLSEAQSQQPAQRGGSAMHWREALHSKKRLQQPLKSRPKSGALLNVT